MNRITPNMPAGAYMSYRIISPSRTHFGPATCEDVDCQAYIEGWRSIFDESTELGARQAYYVRHESGRGFRETRDETGLTVFSFSPGQRCFRKHVYRNELPPIYRVQGGDFRGNPRGIVPVNHVRPEDWIEDFAEHQDKITTILERG